MVKFIVCSKCGRVMDCCKTGKDVRFQATQQTYAGDEYQCKECGLRVVVCDSAARSEAYSSKNDGYWPPNDEAVVVKK